MQVEQAALRPFEDGVTDRSNAQFHLSLPTVSDHQSIGELLEKVDKLDFDILAFRNATDGH